MEHERYMQEALELAREAAEAGEVPVGCVIVLGDTVVGRGRNRREEKRSALAHAEVEAIGEACRKVGGWRLDGARLYVTLEPCPMCAGAIMNARIRDIFFGAKDPAAGACGGVLNLFEEGFPSRARIRSGILEKECRELLGVFFERLRKNEK